ncbi:MAG: thiosulfate oxidation carrier protein SoxY [Gammaproteobacteria bacterium]|nr:thiosulfate oxidation carrier protein SoxY [Gammaproteobacteria bacterium]
MKVQTSRRRLLQGVISLVALSSMPLKLLARAVKAFEAEELDEVYRELFGDLPVTPSDEIRLKIPDIAENGAVVPVTISTDISGVEAVYVVIDKNPNPLSASFHVGAMSPPDISLRVKMGKSSMVRALVRTEDKVYMAGKEVKVTIGGCGG